MLYKPKVIQALEERRDDFLDFNMGLQADTATYLDALDKLPSISMEEIQESLKEVPYPGALPTEEHIRYRSIIVPFSERWKNHREARAWALNSLGGVPTYAVDGSQIQPQKDFSIPVGVVQIGWFENPHSPDKKYLKDLAVNVLTPDEIYVPTIDGELFSDQEVSLRRYKMEIWKLIEYMESHSDSDPKGVLFFDGSLVVSFADRLSPEYRRGYIKSMTELISASDKYRVPVVGYIDTSYAKDLVTMLEYMRGFQTDQRISDAPLISRKMSWGDRSQVYICARGDILDEYIDHQSGKNFSREICFTYLKTTCLNPPARVDFPYWVYRENLLDHLLNVVIAEVIVGNGYPYVLEAADAVSVITFKDRERFYRVFQEFAEKNNLSLRFSAKALSKRRRRSP